MNEKRETLFEDRTHCHADYIHAGHTSQDTTAAVGVIKSVHIGEERSVYTWPIHVTYLPDHTPVSLETNLFNVN